MARNIEEVVGILQSDRFRKLVEESRLDPGLEEKYKNFKSNYDRARNAEFTITVAGIFQLGKNRRSSTRLSGTTPCRLIMIPAPRKSAKSAIILSLNRMN